MFDEDISRIEIRTENDKKEVINTEICYNTITLGEYGVCETEMEAPFNWGFCSRSCGQKEIEAKEKDEGIQGQYEVGVFKFFDIPPENTYLAGIYQK